MKNVFIELSPDSPESLKALIQDLEVVLEKTTKQLKSTKLKLKKLKLLEKEGPVLKTKLGSGARDRCYDFLNIFAEKSS
jgi:hypothetical protein